MTPIRVLHCPELVGGNAQQLARAERALGLESVAVAFDQTVFAYDTDEVLLRAVGPAAAARAEARSACFAVRFATSTSSTSTSAGR